MHSEIGPLWRNASRYVCVCVKLALVMRSGLQRDANNTIVVKTCGHGGPLCCRVHRFITIALIKASDVGWCIGDIIQYDAQACMQIVLSTASLFFLCHNCTRPMMGSVGIHVVPCPMQTYFCHICTHNRLWALMPQCKHSCVTSASIIDSVLPCTMHS